MTEPEIPDEDSGDDPVQPRRRVELLPGPLDAVDIFIPKAVFVLGSISAIAMLALAATVKDSSRWYFLILGVAILGYFARMFYLNWTEFTTTLREIEQYGRQVRSRRSESGQS